MSIARVVRASKASKKYDILEPGDTNIGYGAVVDKGTGKLSGKVEQNQADVSAYKAYHNEVETARAGKSTGTTNAGTAGKKTTTETASIKQDLVTPGTVKIGDNLTAKTPTSSFKSGKLLGAVGLTGAATAAGIFGTNYLLGTSDPGDNSNGGDSNVFDKIKEWLTGGAAQAGGGSYYLGDNDPGEPGSTSVITEAAETLSGYGPLIVGALLVIGVVYLATKKKAVKKTARSNRA